MLKNKPIVAITIGYIIGIIMGLYCKNSIVFLYLILINIYFLFKKPHLKKFKLISIRRYFRYIKLNITKKVFILILISSIISNSVTLYKKNEYNKFTNIFNEQDIVLKAKVISNEMQKKHKKTYIVKSNNKKFYLNVKKNVNIEYGDFVFIKGTFNKSKERTNYRGFDYKEYLKAQGIYGTINSNNVSILGKNTNIFNQIFLKIKNLIQNIFNQDISNVLLGILLGYKDELSEEIKDNFNESNILHILAVSGMHVGYLVFFCTFLFNRLFGKRLSNILSILVLVFYINIVGFSPSVERAVFMAVLFLISKLIYRKSDIWTSISLSLLCALIYNPFSIRNTGLLFSYLATIGIIIYLKFFYSDKKILNAVGITVSATGFILPITAICFNKIPILSVIISLIAGVFVGPIFILSLFFVIFGKKFDLIVIKSIINIMVKMLLHITNIGSTIPFNKIYVILPNYLEVLIFYFIIFVYLFLFSIYKPKRKQNNAFNKRIKNLMNLLKFKYNQNKKKVVSIVIIIPFILFIINIYPKSLKIYFIDVGQGDSCLIVTPENKKILIDGGGNENYDVGKNTLIPYLLARRIKKIDYVVVSHFDTDHIGGILNVMEELKVNTVVISKQGEENENYKKFIKVVKAKKIKVVVVEKGDTLQIEKELEFDILWPNNSRLISQNILNNNSIVCKMNYRTFSMLFTGDIEEEAEKQILQEYKDNLQIINSTILKVAHHGSRTSSIQEFLEAIKSKIALIGVGENNKFGHPNEEVLKRLKNCGNKIYRTDQMGEIEIKVNEKGKVNVKKFIN